MKLWRYNIKTRKTGPSRFAIRRSGQATRWPAILVFTPWGSVILGRSVPRDMRAAPCPRKEDHGGHVWPSRGMQTRNARRYRVCMGRPS